MIFNISFIITLALPDNHPPELSQLHYEKDDGHILVAQLKASDPERHNIDYYLLSGKGVKVTEKGLMVWPSASRFSQDIMIRLTDECGFYSDHRLSLVVRNEPRPGQDNTGMVVGICIGVLLGVGVCVGVVVFVRRKHNKEGSEDLQMITRR